MAIRDNGFTADTTASRGERLQSVSSNIGTYAAGLGITGSRLTWYQDASDEWNTAVANTITESGEKEDAVEDFNRLQYRISLTAGDWSTFYEGVETSTTEKPAEAGSYDIRVRAIAGDKLGAWSGVIEVVIEEVVE